MIAETKSRLSDQVPALKLVSGALEFAALGDANPFATPAAYVLMLEEQPSASALLGVVEQDVKATVGILLAVKNVSDAIGVAATSDVEALKNSIRGVLLGWAPAESYAPYQLAKSALLTFRNGVVWWQESFETSYLIRSQ